LLADGYTKSGLPIQRLGRIAAGHRGRSDRSTPLERHSSAAAALQANGPRKTKNAAAVCCSALFK
jgi:hypothetical protein